MYDHIKHTFGSLFSIGGLVGSITLRQVNDWASLLCAIAGFIAACCTVNSWWVKRQARIQKQRDLQARLAHRAQAAHTGPGPGALPFLIGGLVFISFAALAQPTNTTTAAQLPDAVSDSFIGIMFRQVLNSPASMLVVIGLSIVAYLLEIWPRFPSVWIPIICILGGPCVYWIFSPTASVPKIFPHPSAVLIVNGLVCGLASTGAHKWIVQKLLYRGGNPPPAGGN